MGYLFRCSFSALAILLVLTLACSKHEQTSYSSTFEKKDTAETDPAKLLLQAIIKGDVLEVKKYLKQVDVNALIADKGTTFLMESIATKKYHVTELLLAEGADPLIKNEKGMDAFEMYKDDNLVTKILNKEELSEEKLLKVLIDDGIKPRRVDVVEWIATKNVNINQKVGRTAPLIYACSLKVSEDGLYPVIEALLKFMDVDVNIKVSNRTPLSEATANNYNAIVQLLKSHGA